MILYWWYLWCYHAKTIPTVTTITGGNMDFDIFWYFQWFFRKWRSWNLGIVMGEEFFILDWQILRYMVDAELSFTNWTYPYTFEKSTFYMGILLWKSYLWLIFGNFHHLRILNVWENYHKPSDKKKKKKRGQSSAFNIGVVVFQGQCLSK